MVFTPPSWVPPLPEIPDSITVGEFLNSEKYGRFPFAQSKDPYTCGLSGTTFTTEDVVQRVDYMARALSRRLRFDPNDGTEWDRVVGQFSLNTIDFIPLSHAIHRLSGIVTPANAAYSAEELEHQLRSSGAKALFTCVPLLDTALKATRAIGIPDEAVFILPLAGAESQAPFINTTDLVKEGKKLPELAPLKWVKGQGKRQVAYLCYSSGTSGLPKAVMISHYNVIANILQTSTYEASTRHELGLNPSTHLGLLPMSHIYGLTLCALLMQYRGDQVIVLPKFDLDTFLNAVQRYKIQRCNVVPPILIQMLHNKDRCDQYDLSSMKSMFCGAAPLGSEVAELFAKRYLKSYVSQGYGMTEASPLVFSTSELDILVGSSGSLLPGYRAKIVDTDGKEVTEYNQRGELHIQSPSVVLGYLNNEKANAETFVWDEEGRWLKTGDEVLVQKSAQGNEHFFVVDRIKELIKVKGLQVAPAELEAHLLSHNLVNDCAIIPIPDDAAGEVPKAFIVKDKSAAGKADDEIVKVLLKHVQDHKARHKWLKGGIEFIDAIPKSPSGKILRRLLRDKEREARREKGAKL